METTPEFLNVFKYADSIGDRGYHDTALDTVRKAHNRMRANLTTADEYYYYTYVNVIYNHRGAHEMSIAIADSLLEMLQTEENEPIPAGNEANTWKIVGYNIKADALFALGNYTDAYNYYHLAQVLAIETKDSCSLRTYTYSLAMTLYRQQRFAQSADRFKEALRQAEYCNEDFNVFYFKQELLDNIGLCYNALKQYDSALLYYNEALTYLNKMTGKFETKLPHVYEAPKAVVYGNMAEVLMHKGKYDSARLLYEYSININLQKGYTNTDALIDQVKLSDLYFKTGELMAAKATLDKVKAELDTIPDARVEMMWHKLMWQYSEARGDSLGSFRHLRSYMVRNEEHQRANKELMETDLDMRVRDLQKQYRINMLMTDRKQQKVYLVVVTVFAIMAVIIVILGLRNARKTAKHVEELETLNNTVEQQKQQLEATLEQLQARQKDNSRILKSVAHDVMSPIAAIVSLADIMLSDPNASREEHLEMANLIKEASLNSLTLSKDILEASKDMQGNSLKKATTDINQIVARAVELMNVKAQGKGQKIEVKNPKATVMAYVDEDKIRRVVTNILSNAIKFSHENSAIKVSLFTTGGSVQITVKDTGIGISEQHKPHVFDMFTDARMHGTSGEMPHGLGLSISQQIIGAHGGEIWFDSEEGKGTTFHISFPQTAY